MFVTSVDVEDGLWTKSKRRKKKKQAAGMDFVHEEGLSYEDSGYYGDTTSSLYYGEADDQANVDQFADADASAVGATPQSDAAFDWAKAEASWESGATGSFTPGTIVGWKVRMLTLRVRCSDSSLSGSCNKPSHFLS